MLFDYPFLSKEYIKDIAEELDCGFCVYIHKTSKKSISVPDEMQFPTMDTDAWEEELEELEENFSDYIEIEKWTTREAFNIMEGFALSIKDKHFQKQLLNALERKKPFQNFKYLVETSPKFRDEWFAYKNTWQQNYVNDYIENFI